jgi:hypothetical protein
LWSDLGNRAIQAESEKYWKEQHPSDHGISGKLDRTHAFETRK